MISSCGQRSTCISLEDSLSNEIDRCIIYGCGVAILIHAYIFHFSRLEILFWSVLNTMLLNKL